MCIGLTHAELDKLRYPALDALRGVAALAVVAFHCSQAWMPHGYLAVDFFFVLSGFVVSHAYGAALACGTMSWHSFAVRRAIRLYPMSLLGVALGVVVLALKWWSIASSVDDLPRMAISVGLNALVLPTPLGGQASHHLLFPGNAALWTLSFELIANLVWAAFCANLSTRGLVFATAASAACFVALSIYFRTTNLGFDVQTFVGGLARVAFGFSLGALLQHISPVLKAGRSIGAAPLGIALLAVLAAPVAPWPGDLILVLGAVLVILPLIMTLGMTQGEAGHVGAWLGRLSYPVYAIHLPIVGILLAASRKYYPGVAEYKVAFATLTISLAAAALALRIYDEPVRRIMGRAARRRGWIGGSVRSESEGAPPPIPTEPNLRRRPALTG